MEGGLIEEFFGATDSVSDDSELRRDLERRVFNNIEDSVTLWEYTMGVEGPARAMFS